MIAQTVRVIVVRDAPTLADKISGGAATRKGAVREQAGPEGRDPSLCAAATPSTPPYPPAYINDGSHPDWRDRPPTETLTAAPPARAGFWHNVIAHQLLVLCPPVGEWLHDRTKP